MTYFLSKLTKSLSLEESSWAFSGTAAVGGVVSVGVVGLELGRDVAGLEITGVEVAEAEVMIGSAASRFDSTSLQRCRG